LVCLIAVLRVILAAIRADAAEWYAHSNVSQQVSYDDNFDLATRSDEADSEWWSDSTASLNVGGRAPNLEVQFNSVFDYAYFPENSSLNSADQAFNLNTTYQLERATVGLGADFIRDTTRTSDVDDTGLFIRANKRRELYRLGPTWTYQLSPLESLNAYGDYSSVSYQTKDLDGYSQITGGFGWTRQLTARTQIQTRLSGFHFHTGAHGGRETNFAGLEIGGTHLFSERWQASFFAGPRYVWMDGTVRYGPQGARQRVSDKDDSAGYVLSANVRYQAGERTALVADASRDVTPGTTNGIIQQTTAFGLFFNHQLLEKVALDLSGRYSIQENVGGSDSLRRDYATVSPGVRWQLTQGLSLRCSYRFSWQRYEQSGETANSNAVFATLTYQLPRLSASR
jgi:hypothetical protein